MGWRRGVGLCAGGGGFVIITGSEDIRVLSSKYVTLSKKIDHKPLIAYGLFLYFLAEINQLS